MRGGKRELGEGKRSRLFVEEGRGEGQGKMEGGTQGKLYVDTKDKGVEGYISEL